MLMLVLNILNNKKTSDVIDDIVFIMRMIVNGLLVFPVIAD